MARRTYVERNGHAEGWVALIVMAIAVVYAKWISAFVVGMTIAWLFSRYMQRRKDHELLHLVNHTAIALEADHQNMLYQMGDPAGIYGRYDPVTMPMTARTMNLDDYDDGLREWL